MCVHIFGQSSDLRYKQIQFSYIHLKSDIYEYISTNTIIYNYIIFMYIQFYRLFQYNFNTILYEVSYNFYILTQMHVSTMSVFGRGIVFVLFFFSLFDGKRRENYLNQRL